MHAPNLSSELAWTSGFLVLACALLVPRLRVRRAAPIAACGLAASLGGLVAAAGGYAAATRLAGWTVLLLLALAVLSPVPRAVRRVVVGILVTGALVLVLLLKESGGHLHHGHALLLLSLPLVVTLLRPRPRALTVDGAVRPAVRFACPRCGVLADWAEGGFPCPDCGLFVHADWTPRDGEDGTRLANPVAPRGTTPIDVRCPGCGRRARRPWGRSECGACGLALRLSWNQHLLPSG